MSTKKISKKNKTVALILAIFLGPYGGHQFYVGKIGKGILYLFTAGLCGIGWIVDIVRILTNKFTDNQGLFLIGEQKDKTIKTTQTANQVAKQETTQETTLSSQKTSTNTPAVPTEPSEINSKHVMPFFYTENDILCYNYSHKIAINKNMCEHIKSNINEKLTFKSEDEEDSVAVYLCDKLIGHIINRTLKSVFSQWNENNWFYNIYIDKLNLKNDTLTIISGFYRNLSIYKENEFEVHRVNKEAFDSVLFVKEGAPIHVKEVTHLLEEPVFMIVDQYGQELAKAPKTAVNFADEDENYSYGYITEIFKNDEYEVSGFSFIIYTRK